jgi:hypothetical protein
MTRTVRASVEIAAPLDDAWSVLEDFERYPEWNPFTHRVVLKGRTLGERVELHVRMGKLDRVMNEELRAWEPRRRMGWGMDIGRGLLIHATRYQELEDLGADRCRYTTHERFEGLLAPLTLLLFRADIEAGFRGCAEALKARVEQLRAA